MDVHPSNFQDISYAGESALLVVGSDATAAEEAARAVRDLGLGVGASLTIERALDRLNSQAASKAIWIEIDADCGEQMDDLLDRVSRDVIEQRYAAIVSTKLSSLDAVAFRLNDEVELIVDPTPTERIAALAAATARHQARQSVSDVANDRSADRLRQLSEEVSRIASTLARLSAGPGNAPKPTESPETRDTPPLAAETVRKVIQARRLRARYFREELFADPAWDMLLDLLQAEIAQHRVPVSSLCIAASVPATTALRWLKTMVREGIFVRRADPHDGRRVFVELAAETSLALRRYFAEVGQVAVI